MRRHEEHAPQVGPRPALRYHPGAVLPQPLRRVQVLAIAVAWLLVSAPLTTLGFGSDTDAWLVADVTDYIVAQGRYLRSRTTGFPLFEIAVTPLVQLGNWQLSNLLALASGLVLLATLVSLGRAGHYRHPVLVLGTFMFLPVVVKNASVTMDYIPALALLMLAYRALVTGRWTLASVFIGVAAGVRPSSICFAVPAAVYACRRSGDIGVAFRLAGVAAGTGLVAFSPSLAHGAFGIVPTMPWMKGIYNGVRLVGLAQAVVLAWVAWHARDSIFDVARRWRADALVLFHLLVIVLWLALFVPLPDEPEYLLPAVPSVLWLLDRALSRRRLVTVAAVLLSYHVVSVEVSGTRGGTKAMQVAIRQGFTLADIEDRRFKLALREAATHWNGETPTLLMEQALAITARNPSWVLDPVVNEYRQRDGNLYVSLRYYRDDLVRHLSSRGVRIVALREREWEFHQPGRDTAWPLIDFVSREELDRLLGRRIVGRPLS